MAKKLIEAGRILSAANENKIRSALSSLAGILDAMAKEQPPEETANKKKKTVTEARAVLEEAAKVLKTSDSLDGQRNLIRTAIKEKMKNPMDPNASSWVWLRDIFPSETVFEHETNEGTKLYQIPYNVDSTGEYPSVNLGDPVEVQLAYVPIANPLQESLRTEGEFVELMERAIGKDGSVPIKIIQPGWGSSGYYPADVLKRDGPNVFAAGTHMYWNHPTITEARERPERDLNDLAATLTTPARWEDNGPKGPGLYAEAKVVDHYRPAVESLAGSIGLSIRANGSVVVGEAEGRKGKIVTSLAEGDSVDFVTKAGAGGEILQLFEAARPQGRTENNMALLTEAEQKKLQDDNAALKEAAQKNSEILEENRRLKESQILVEARSFVSENLPSDLPEMTRNRLIESLSKAPTIKDGALDKDAFKTKISEAVKAEAEYLAAITGSGKIKGMGTTVQESTANQDIEQAQSKLTESMSRIMGSTKLGEIAAKGR